MSSEAESRPPMGNLEGRKVLFIAYFFPPTVSTGVPGCMRTIKFLRNLEGGECHVLTTPESRLTQSESALSHLNLPVNGESIHRVASWDLFKSLLRLRSWLKTTFRKNKSPSQIDAPASSFRSSSENEAAGKPNRLQRMKDFIYDLCYFPDQAGPWILPAVLYGRKLVKNKNIDVIFATGSPWSGLIVGYLISRLTGAHLIVDFRDPWMNNPFHHSKGAFLDRWALSWEQRIVQRADAVSLNTEPLRDEFLERYPYQDPEKFFVMPNGYDLVDFPESSSSDNSTSGTLTLCHTGFLYGVRDPETLLEAIGVANEHLTKQNLQIRFRQIGDVQLSYDLKARYENLIQDGSLILEAPRPYQECLAALMESDFVVNIQPATRSQVPSKLYDYLAINRPILNITPSDGALGQMVINHGLGEIYDFQEVHTLSQRLIELAENPSYLRTFSGYPGRGLFDVRKSSSDFCLRIKYITY